MVLQMLYPCIIALCRSINYCVQAEVSSFLGRKQSKNRESQRSWKTDISQARTPMNSAHDLTSEGIRPSR